MNWLPLLLAAAVLGQTDVKLTYHNQLEGAQRMPAIFSPDGTTISYFSRSVTPTEEGEPQIKHVYNLADADGGNQRVLFESPVEWDDFLNAVTSDQMFSSDGKRFAVATTDNGQPMRAETNPGRPVPAIVTADGEVEIISCELGSCGGFGFVDNGLLVLDTPGLISGEGYQLRLHASGESKVIQSEEKLAATCLRISPNGRRAAFFISSHVGSAMVRLRSVDLATGQPTDSPEFRSHHATFDGRPQLFWDDDSRGVYCHVSTHEQSKWPYELTHYHFDDRKGVVASPQRNIGVSCNLGSGRLAMWHPESDGCSILDTRTEKMAQLPEYNYIVGGRGQRVVVADLERNAVYAATLNESVQQK